MNRLNHFNVNLALIDMKENDVDSLLAFIALSAAQSSVQRHVFTALVWSLTPSTMLHWFKFIDAMICR